MPLTLLEIKKILIDVCFKKFKEREKSNLSMEYHHLNTKSNVKHHGLEIFKQLYKQDDIYAFIVGRSGVKKIIMQEIENKFPDLKSNLQAKEILEKFFIDYNRPAEYQHSALEQSISFFQGLFITNGKFIFYVNLGDQAYNKISLLDVNNQEYKFEEENIEFCSNFLQKVERGLCNKKIFSMHNMLSENFGEAYSSKTILSDFLKPDKAVIENLIVKKLKERKEFILINTQELCGQAIAFCPLPIHSKLEIDFLANPARKNIFITEINTNNLLQFCAPANQEKLQIDGKLFNTKRKNSTDYQASKKQKLEEEVKPVFGFGMENS